MEEEEKIKKEKAIQQLINSQNELFKKTDSLKNASQKQLKQYKKYEIQRRHLRNLLIEDGADF